MPNLTPVSRLKSRPPACPREALEIAVDGSGESYASLSRMIGRPDRYLRRFVTAGRPLALDAREHKALADFFGLAERDLGVRDLWVPMEEAA